MSTPRPMGIVTPQDLEAYSFTNANPFSVGDDVETVASNTEASPYVPLVGEVYTVTEVDGKFVSVKNGSDTFDHFLHGRFSFVGAIANADDAKPSFMTRLRSFFNLNPYDNAHA